MKTLLRSRGLHPAARTISTGIVDVSPTVKPKGCSCLHKMKFQGGQFETGQPVSVNSACVQADLVFHDQGLGKGRVPEDHPLAEVKVRENERIPNPQQIL